MKIKKAFDICKKSGSITTYFINGEQWLCDGSALYPIPGVPELSEEYICQLYDINDKQREKISFHIYADVPQKIDFNDAAKNEVPAEPLSINIVVDGLGECVPLLWERGLTLIKRQYLAPLSDSQDENITYWVRYYSENEEKVYVVIKIGLLLYAIIAPISPLDNIVKNIESLYTAAKTTIIEAK